MIKKLFFADLIIVAFVTVALCQEESVPEGGKNVTESSRKEKGINALKDHKSYQYYLRFVVFP